ncbi:hypothetical protein ACFE04_016066 [Oxalis oulophora]
MAPSSKIIKLYNQKFETADSSSKSHGKLHVAEKQITKTRSLTYEHQNHTNSNQTSLNTTKAIKTTFPALKTHSTKSRTTAPARKTQSTKSSTAPSQRGNVKNKAYVGPSSYAMAAPQPQSGYVETYEREIYRRAVYVSPPTSGKGKQTGGGGKAKFEEYESSRWVKSNNNSGKSSGGGGSYYDNGYYGYDDSNNYQA